MDYLIRAEEYADAEYACWALNLNYNCAKLFDGVLPRGFV